MLTTLVVYSELHKNIENTLIEFNNVHPKIKFTMEKETHHRINYLDMTITKEYNKLTFNIIVSPPK